MSVGRVLVYGGKGALGAVCVSQFKSSNWVCKILDFTFMIYRIMIIIRYTIYKNI